MTGTPSAAPNADTNPLLAYFLLGTAMALVGSYVALSRPLLAVFPVFLLAWLRFGIGALAMPHWLRRPAGEAPLGSRARGLLFMQSLFGNFLFSLCMLNGVRLTGAVSAGVIMAAIPAAVAVMSRIFLGERASPRVWLAVGCAVLGIVLLTLGKPAAESGAAGVRAEAWLGNLLVFGAVLSEAAYVVIGKKLSATVGAKRVAAIINLWGLALMTPFGLAAAFQFDFGGVHPGDWALLLFYALAASVWSVWLWMTGTRFAPAAQGGVMTVMLPVGATLVGVVWLGESIFRLQWLALGLALTGVLLVTLAPRPSTQA